MHLPAGGAEAVHLLEGELLLLCEAELFEALELAAVLRQCVAHVVPHHCALHVALLKLRECLKEYQRLAELCEGLAKLAQLQQCNAVRVLRYCTEPVVLGTGRVLCLLEDRQCALVEAEAVGGREKELQHLVAMADDVQERVLRAGLLLLPEQRRRDVGDVPLAWVHLRGYCATAHDRALDDVLHALHCESDDLGAHLAARLLGESEDVAPQERVQTERGARLVDVHPQRLQQAEE
mmetsp:Transcript_17834/g.69145  ORF Transcript_17834/g.69145 Transcript_17834/m.69145 type:complete len:236 (-) Transcript_17834:826-1533(-)